MKSNYLKLMTTSFLSKLMSPPGELLVIGHVEKSCGFTLILLKSIEKATVLLCFRSNLLNVLYCVFTRANVLKKYSFIVKIKTV